MIVSSMRAEATSARGIATRKVASLALIACLSLLSACGSSGAVDTSGVDARSLKSKGSPPNGGGGSPAPTTTDVSTPAPMPTATVVYDASIGTGVDSSGFASLPLRSGAHRYFVSSASGSDANGCGGAQQAATPLRSIAAAASCVQGGSGDQVLVAEGTRYSAGFPTMDGKDGYSAAYPMVIQSYDPADPLNEGKYGRATAGNRPVVNTGATGQQIVSLNSPLNYVAIRGFDINPGNIDGAAVMFLGANNDILIENNIFRYTQLLFVNNAHTNAVHHVVRGNSFYGQWSSSGMAHGIYEDSCDSLTVEGNVFWHVGWKPGASRDDAAANGGATMFSHAVYAQSNTSVIERRNLFMDGAADGSTLRGDATVTENVYIDNPISIYIGQGTDYSVGRPTGIAVEVSYNAVLGDADVNSTNPRGIAVSIANARSGSAVHHNLFARNHNPAGINVHTFETAAIYNQPTYVSYHDNRAYQWAAVGATKSEIGAYPGQDHATYDNNVWDDLALGTNLNVGAASFPNTYTADQLYATLGCNDKATCAARMIETPEFNWAARARAVLWQGYGMP